MIELEMLTLLTLVLTQMIAEEVNRLRVLIKEAKKNNEVS